MSVNWRLNGLVTRLDLIHHLRSDTDSRSCRRQEEMAILWVGGVEEGLPEKVDSTAGCGDGGSKIIKARIPRAWQSESPGEEGACLLSMLTNSCLTGPLQRELWSS